MTDRRYDEAEVAAIFERAAEVVQPTERRQPVSSDGMTLAELEEIGREVGIPAERIVQAARSLDRGEPRASRTLLGLPVGVERIIDLDRRLSDEEWERLVVDLRETFDARGRVASEGSLRQWSNGNLQALLEPTATGYRVRLRTLKGDARARLVGGLAMLGGGAVAAGAAVLLGALGDAGMVMAIGTLGVAGAMMAGTAVATLPRWARVRQAQMEDIARRLEQRGRPALADSHDAAKG
jgi:hypothetical protein